MKSLIYMNIRYVVRRCEKGTGKNPLRQERTATYPHLPETLIR